LPKQIGFTARLQSASSREPVPTSLENALIEDTMMTKGDEKISASTDMAILTTLNIAVSCLIRAGWVDERLFMEDLERSFAQLHDRLDTETLRMVRANIDCMKHFPRLN
jgi:hypothetical protein